MSEVDREKRLSQLRKEVPTRGFERHPTILEDVSALPVELQSPALDSFVEGEVIESIISFPPQLHHGYHYVPKQALLFTLTDMLHLQASILPAQEPQTTLLNGHELMYMRISLLLLYGLLEIVAEGQTSPTQLRVEFNTVAWHPISIPLQKLLRAVQAPPERSMGEYHFSEVAREAIKCLPLKLVNGVKIYGLLPGEKLHDIVFQPGTWKRWLLLFQRPVTPDILLLLCSNFVVVITEELGLKYGWVISYIPRESISSMTSQPLGLWKELTIHLKRKDQTASYKLLLKDQAIKDWKALWIAYGGRWQETKNAA